MAKRDLQIDAGMFLIPDFLDGNALWALIRDFISNLPGYQPQIWAAGSSLGTKLSLLELQSLVLGGASAFSWKRDVQPRGEGAISGRRYTPAGLEHATHLFRISVKDQHPTYLATGAYEAERRVAYRQYVDEEHTGEVALIRRGTHEGLPTASDKFCAELQAALDRQFAAKPRGRPQKL